MDDKLTQQLSRMRKGETAFVKIDKGEPMTIEKGQPYDTGSPQLAKGLSNYHHIAKVITPGSQDIGQLAEGPSPQKQSDQIFHNMYHHQVSD